MGLNLLGYKANACALRSGLMARPTGVTGVTFIEKWHERVFQRVSDAIIHRRFVSTTVIVGYQENRFTSFHMFHHVLFGIFAWRTILLDLWTPTR